MPNERPLSVLFLTRYPEEGASSRYRVYQYIPHLESAGIDCTVSSFMDTPMYRLSLSAGHTGAKVWLTVRAMLRRLRMLARFRQFDVIYMQRELFPMGPPIVERMLKRMGAVLAYDYDDALFIKKPSRFNPLATFLRSPGKVRALFKLVDCTVAGNDWLRDAAREEGGTAVTLEVAEDASRYASPEEKFGQDRPLTIGWLGSPSTAKYLTDIAPALREIASRHPQVQWEIMGSGDFAMDGVPWQAKGWSIEAEKAALSRYDIGLMPLPMQDWSRGKSGGKARTYMAAAVVPVVQKIGYNIELLRQGETGFLCVTHADWVEALDALIGDRTLREKVARAARREVQTRFDPGAKALQMAGLLRKLAAREPVP